MNQAVLPLITEPTLLEQHLDAEHLLIVDLCKPESYTQAHLPGAVHLDYKQIVGTRKPAVGLLPEEAALSQVLSSIGMTPETVVVAYDDEGGGRASRLLWTLEVIGHDHYSLLNGGLHAWMAENRPLNNEPVHPSPSDCPVHYTDRGIADRDYILQHLHDPNVVLLDARTPAEYTGTKKFAGRAGHIPGAVNFDWVNAIDQNRNLRLKDDEELRQTFTDLGVLPDKEVIVYCQTHHRSAHTYMVLKHLGYRRIKGYPGSWSDWGNQPDLPVET